jgi:O-antigen/teichoic acid export membrane protein
VIQPLVGLNLLVFSSFTILYTPVASRLFARNDRSGVADLYWRTAIWMAVFSFPIFAVTTSLAEPITVTLYGERYADSALYLALLSFGAYTNAALGFNGLTLRVFGFVRYTIVINLIAAAVNVTLNLLLIPPYGALGAAISTMSTTILHNILKQLGLRLGTGIDVFAWKYLRVYVLIAAATLGLGAIQWLFQPNIIVGLALAGIASLIVVVANRNTVRLEETIPEVLRLPFMRQLLGVRR